MLWASPDLISIVIVLIVISMDLRVVSQFIQLSNSVKERKMKAI